MMSAGSPTGSPRGVSQAAAKNTTLGIDLGSHTASLALNRNGQIDVLANQLGVRSTPCCVAFNEQEILCGENAKAQAFKNLANTFEDVRVFVQHAAAGADSQHVHVPVKDKRMSGLELLTIFFQTLANQAEHHVGYRVTECVLGIPEYFTRAEVDLLIQAASAAGLNIRQTVPEGVAIALAHGVDDIETFPPHPSGRPQRVVVVDHGWSSLTVTVLDVVSGMIRPVLTKRTSTASGSSVVQAMTQFNADFFRRKFKVDMSGNARSMARLARACDEAVQSLSTAQEANIALDSLFEGIDYAQRINRARFEDISKNVYNEIVPFITSCLSEASCTPEQVDVVLFGGAFSKTPKSQALIRGLFPSSRFGIRVVEADEAAAYGSAVVAGCLQKLEPVDDAMLPLTPVENNAALRNLINLKGASSAISLRFPSESADAVDGPASVVAVPIGTPLPTLSTIRTQVPASSLGAGKKGSAQVLSGTSVVGEIVFALPESVGEGESVARVDVDVEMNVEGGLTVRARSGESVLEEISIPVA